MTPLLDRHGEAVDLFSARVAAVRPDQWEAPTPCAEWTVRDLVNHLTAEQLWVPALVADGATMAEVGDAYDGDVLGADPAVSWQSAAQVARETFLKAPDLTRMTVHLSYGDTDAAAYCSQMVADLAVHSWDLSRAIGAEERIPAALLDFTVREFSPYAAELAKTGLFAEAVEPPPGAGVQDKLLALLGRTP